MNQNKLKTSGGVGSKDANTFFTTSKLIDETEPDAALLENVPGVKSKSREQESRSIQIIEQELQRKTLYFMLTFFLPSLLPRKRRRFWWTLIKKARIVCEAQLAKLKELVESVAMAMGDMNVDDFLLDSKHPLIVGMLNDYKPTLPRYIQLHGRMAATTMETHAKLRMLLGIVPRSHSEGQAFSSSLTRPVYQALCARERDVLDI